MKNISMLFLTLACFNVFSQNINNDKNGYTEVIKIDSVKSDVIYNKLKEWISLNYKSANDVIQLDTENKIIVKGNFICNVKIQSFSFNWRIVNTLIFSIKDNKYKIDLIPTDIINTETNVSGKFESSIFKEYLSNNILNKEDFMKLAFKNSRKAFADMGYTDKKIEKWMKKIEKDLYNSYDDYLNNYKNFNIEIKNIFSSIKTKVSNKENW